MYNHVLYLNETKKIFRISNNQTKVRFLIYIAPIFEIKKMSNLYSVLPRRKLRPSAAENYRPSPRKTTAYRRGKPQHIQLFLE